MKARRQVGIDLGSTAVRVVEVAGLDADSLAQITRCAIVPLQPGAITSGRIQDVGAVAWAVDRALKDSGVSRYGAILGVSSTETALSRIALPAVLKPTEWDKALRTVDRPISPKLPLATSTVAVYPLNDVDAGNPTQRTLLASATTDDEIDKVTAIAKRAKVTPRAIDLSAAATVRALTRCLLRNEDVATLVDIGATKVTVATRQGLHLRSVRTFEGGGDRITRALMGALGCTYEQAEEAKLTLRLSNEANAPDLDLTSAPAATLYGSMPTSSTTATGSDPVTDALTTAAGNLIEEIAAAVEADAAVNGSPTQGLLLCGGTSLLRGLREQIVARVGAPAVVGRPWARVVPSRHTRQALIADSSGLGAEDPIVLLSLATAVGLAIWKDPS